MKRTWIRRNTVSIVRGAIPNQPRETLRGNVLLRLQLIADEVLNVLGLGRGGKLPLTDFLQHLSDN
jgi:hypothetical protein